MKNKIPRILVTSLSKKVPLLRELDKALKKISKHSTIIGADIDKQCIGSYFVDEFWQMPALSEITDKLLVAKLSEMNITGIIPTRDGELVFFAKRSNLLDELGISLMLPNEVTVENCLDKISFSELLKEFQFPVIPSALNVDEIESNQCVVKEELYIFFYKLVCIYYPKLQWK